MIFETFRVPDDALRITQEQFEQDYELFVHLRPLPIDIVTKEIAKKRFQFLRSKTYVRETDFFMCGSCLYMDYTQKQAYLDIVTRHTDRDLAFKDADNEWKDINLNNAQPFSFEAYRDLRRMTDKLPDVILCSTSSAIQPNHVYLLQNKIYLPVSSYKAYSHFNKYSR